jgi:hypothetical protein
MDKNNFFFNDLQRDMFYLKRELDVLKFEINKTNKRMLDFSKIIENLYKEIREKGSYNPSNNYQTSNSVNQTNNSSFQTNRQTNQTDKLFFKPLKGQTLGISNGNKGVSTDKQTNQQTNRQINKEDFSTKKRDLDEANELLESLDSLKKELRLKFKNLTDQELLVFSTIYQLEEEKGYSNYKILSSRLNLSESSIRDYVRRLLSKGIPLEKNKINNKEVKISISPNLKKIASLEAILKLKNL